MLYLENDYCNGAHPEVLKRLVETNAENTLCYGKDCYSEAARLKIKEACETPDAQVFFLTGGTQTNATVIDSVLQLHEGVVSVTSGHISVHEAGAVESSGHKVLPLPEHDGKMCAKELQHFLESFENDESMEHMVFPGMVYITFPTEYGTLYSAKELTEIYEVCQQHQLPLFIDGARLGYGLSAPSNDISLPFLAHHCDVFYVGGTKVGALCGEAVVFTHGNANPHFFTIQKQHGALVAKGRLLGIQFDALFTNGLYMHIAGKAVEMALRMKQLFLDKGWKLFMDSPTNQQFVILSNDVMKEISARVLFTKWSEYDEHHTVCRFVTSWSTPEDIVERLADILPESKS